MGILDLLKHLAIIGYSLDVGATMAIQGGHKSMVSLELGRGMTHHPRCCARCWRIEKLQWRRITCSPTGAELAEELAKTSGLSKISLKTRFLFDDFFHKKLSKTA